MSDSFSGQPSRSSPAAAGSTSQSLISRVRGEDDRAWQDLVRLYSPLVYHWCQRLGLPNQECPDIVQEVFRSVVSSIGEFRRTRPGDTFRGWLRVITRNKVLDFYRRQGRQPNAAGGTDANVRLMATPDVDDDLAEDENDLRAEHALYLRAIEMIRSDFKSQTWDAFWGVVVDGKDAAQVAEELGMRPGTVRVAKSRVLKRLREQLGDGLSLPE